MWTGDIYSTNHNVFAVELKHFPYLKYKVGYEGNHGDYFLNSNVCMYIHLIWVFSFQNKLRQQTWKCRVDFTGHHQ